MIIRYFKQDNSHTLWAKIVHLAILLLCCVIVLILAIKVNLYGMINLFADMPAWGIIGYIAIYIGYIYCAICVYKSIKEEVKKGENNNE